MSDIFEQATRQGTRFQLPHGLVNVEQLWNAKTSLLTDYEEELTQQLESFGKSTRRKSAAKTALQKELELKLAIVTYILDVKEAELAASQNEQDKKRHNQEILALIAQKQNEQKASMSIEELQALLIE